MLYTEEMEPGLYRCRCAAVDAADAIEALSRGFDSMNDANTALYGALPKWIDVGEALPECGETVLVCGSQGGVYTAQYRRRGASGDWWKLNSKSHYCNPTHWMELPEKPTKNVDGSTNDNLGQ